MLQVRVVNDIHIKIYIYIKSTLTTLAKGVSRNSFLFFSQDIIQVFTPIKTKRYSI